MTGGAEEELVCSEAGPEWSEVPADVLRMIAGMLVGVEDYVSLGAVCKSWRHALSSSSAADFPSSSKRHLEYPWLMLAEKKGDDGDGETKGKKKREFYSFYSGKHFALEVPESYGRTCFGSSSGWLLTYATDQQMHLLNPLTRHQLLLPAATTLADQYESKVTPEELLRLNLRKVLIVTCTLDRVPVVVMIYGNLNWLAMAKPGDASWTPIEPSSLYGFSDIALFNGQLLALKLDQLYVCDFLSSASPPCLEAFHIQPPHHPYSRKNLVDLGGELHLLGGDVTWRGDEDSDEACLVRSIFLVHRLSITNKTWEKVADIGDWTVFLGRNSTFALRSSDHPRCVANSIYFTDEDIVYYRVCGGCSMGIYSFEKNNLVWCNEEKEEEEEEEEEEASGDDEEEVGAIITPFPVSHDLASPYCPPLLLAPSLLW